MISLDQNSETSLYEQLYEQLRDEIASGKIAKGARLKSLRELEEDLGVSRTTVSRAYQQLVAEGYIRPSHGSGYFVEDIGPTSYDSGGPPPQLPVPCEPRVRLDFDFSPNRIETGQFPWERWRRAINAAIDYDSFYPKEQATSPKGTWRLRENLSRFLYQHRGVRCSPEQIVICPDAHRAMDTVLSLLDPNKHRFAFEEPGLKGMRRLISHRGFHVSSVPVLDEFSIKMLETANCNVVYTTPSFHFPTGATMSLRNRNLLLRWATLNDAYIIEYDHNGRFRGLGATEIPSLQSLDMYQNVVYIGALAQVLPETLCLAYVVLPPALVYEYESRFASIRPVLPECYELAFADFIGDGTLAKHIRKVGVINKRKFDLTVSCIKKYLPSEVSLTNTPSSGHVVLKIRGCGGARKLVDELEKKHLRIYSLCDYCNECCTGWEDIFILGFASLKEKDIILGIELLGKTVASLRSAACEKKEISEEEQLADQIEDALVSLDASKAVIIARRALELDANPIDLIEKGLAAGMQTISDMFDDGEIGVAELMEAAEVFKAATETLTADMSEAEREAATLGGIILYTVEGDLHDLGKNIVKTMLEANGFKVYDLGRDTPHEYVLDKAEEIGISTIMGSALMTTTMPSQKSLIELMKSKGVRNKYFVVFGGAPVTKEWVDQIGGDVYADTAGDAVAAAKSHLAEGVEGTGTSSNRRSEN